MAQLTQLSDGSYTMEQLEQRFPNGMDTITAYHSLDRPMPSGIEARLRESQYEDRLLPCAEVVNMWFDHLGCMTPVCLPKGTPVITDHSGNILYCLVCCNPSEGYCPPEIRTRTLTQYQYDIYEVPGPTEVVTQQQATTNTIVVAAPAQCWNAQGPRSEEAQQIGGSFSVYQVPVYKVQVNKTTNKTTNNQTNNTQNNTTNNTQTNNTTNNTTTNNTSTVCPPLNVCPCKPTSTPPPVCPSPTPSNGTATNNPIQPAPGAGSATDIPRQAPDPSGPPYVAPVNLN
jgi:hypothetical protein